MNWTESRTYEREGGARTAAWTQSQTSKETYVIGGSMGGRPPASPQGPKFFLVSCSFWEILKKICMLVPPHRQLAPPSTKILDPLLLECNRVTDS